MLQNKTVVIVRRLQLILERVVEFVFLRQASEMLQQKHDLFTRHHTTLHHTILVTTRHLSFMTIIMNRKITQGSGNNFRCT